MQTIDIDTFLENIMTDFESTPKNLTEVIESHAELNPKLFTNDKLKPVVAKKIQEIVNVFTASLEEDDIRFTVSDILLVGSNVSYNYTADSDLDLHILMNTSDYTCPDNLYPLLYSAYRSLFNKRMNISFYGIPVELYVETEDSALKSNGIYSVLQNDWIKHPSKQDIPEIDLSQVKSMEKPFIDRFNKIEHNPKLEDIDQLLADIYDMRKQGMQKENAEYSVENLCFKEFRNDGYLDKLKDMRPEILTQELSLESLQANMTEMATSGHLSDQDIFKARTRLERAAQTQVIVYNNGRFTVSNVKAIDADRILSKLEQMDIVDTVHKYSSGKYNFTDIMRKGRPSTYFTIDGTLKLKNK